MCPILRNQFQSITPDTIDSQGPPVGIADCVLRACHGYGNTHGDRVMGTTGTGTVSDFSTPRHTAYPYCGITGMIQVNYNKVGLIFTALKLFFF